MKTFETQIGQPALAMKEQVSRSLPSDTEKNPRDCKAVTTRSGKKSDTPGITDPTEVEIEEAEPRKEKMVEKAPVRPGSLSFPDNPPKITPPLPYPQRFQKKKLDEQFAKFLNVFKKLQVNIPFADALEQMPNYVKFMKDVMSKKRRLEEYETVNLTEQCSALIQRKMPEKLKVGSFTISCIIGEHTFEKSLCDLGASINLMPTSVFNKLNLGTVKPTTISLQMADRSFTYPRGIIEDVLVKVDKFIFPVDFVDLDMEEDREVPLILGRPFLATGQALIDVNNGSLTLRVNDDEVHFNIHSAMKYPDDEPNCMMIDYATPCIQEHAEDVF